MGTIPSHVSKRITPNHTAVDFAAKRRTVTVKLSLTKVLQGYESSRQHSCPQTLVIATIVWNTMSVPLSVRPTLNRVSRLATRVST